MLIKKAFLALLLLPAAAVFGQIPPPAGSSGKETSSLLWRISGNGLSDTSWLFGTIHLIGQRDFFIRPELRQALESAEQIAFEIKLNDMAMLMSFQELIQLPEGKQLGNELDSVIFHQLKIWVEDSLGLSMDMVSRQKPFALMQMALQRLLPESPASYEWTLLQEAVSAGKEVWGLETLRDQFAVFDSIPVQEQVEWVLEMLEHSDSMKLQYDEMVRVYLRQDIERLSRMIVEDSPEMRKHASALLFDRNRRWIPEMTRLMQKASTLTAVGAGHLGGPQGLLALLRAAGYQVEAVQ